MKPGGARDPEVGHVEISGLVEQEVSRLDVPVHDTAAVCSVERASRLVEPGERLIHRRRPADAEPVLQRPAPEMLHDDERPPLPLADVEDRDRARLAREPGRGESLAGEPSPQGLVPRVLLGQHLDRDRPPEHLVLGAEDLAHAAVADPCRPEVPGR